MLLTFPLGPFQMLYKNPVQAYQLITTDALFRATMGNALSLFWTDSFQSEHTPL